MNAITHDDPDNPWREMADAPRNGGSFDVLCRHEQGREFVVPNLHYAFPPMGRGEMILWGTQNFLSPYLTPLKWRPRMPQQVKP